MKERAEEDRDPLMSRQVDECISQWTRGLLNQYDHESETSRSVLRMQSQSKELVAQILVQLELAQHNGSSGWGIDDISREKDRELVGTLEEKIDRLYRACMRAMPSNGAEASVHRSSLGVSSVSLEPVNRLHADALVHRILPCRVGKQLHCQDGCCSNTHPLLEWSSF